MHKDCRDSCSFGRESRKIQAEELEEAEEEVPEKAEELTLEVLLIEEIRDGVFEACDQKASSMFLKIQDLPENERALFEEDRVLRVTGYAEEEEDPVWLLIQRADDPGKKKPISFHRK